MKILGPKGRMLLLALADMFDLNFMLIDDIC